MLIKEKTGQAVQILRELDIDCWITFVRETSLNRDPVLPFLAGSDLTWHSAFIISRNGPSYAIVGQYDRQGVEDLGVYTKIFSYVEGIKDPLHQTLRHLAPSSIALNYSKASEVCDGLSHGMYLTMVDLLAEIGFQDRIVSAERVVSRLRARKTEGELNRIRKAIEAAQEIFSCAASFMAPGKTEKEVAAFMVREVERRQLELAWDPAHCPAVFSGPDTAEAHYQPTDRKIERGHVLNLDFGVKVDEYCSDLQRTFYVLNRGEGQAPPEVRRGFETIVAAIEIARQTLKPGVQGIEVDAAAREFMNSAGYEGFPHGLGHQVGRFAHDGNALLGPAWEKYSSRPYEIIDEGMVFTLEPRLKVPARGIVTIEEMVVVTSDGAEFLSRPQKELILIGSGSESSGASDSGGALTTQR